MQNTILKSLDKGSEVLKELHKEMSLDRAEGIMDRVGHGIQAQRASLHPLFAGHNTIADMRIGHIGY
jgi:hypothetical protein